MGRGPRRVHRSGHRRLARLSPPSPPADPFGKGRSVARDSAVLLASLIRRAGGTAWLAMLNTSGRRGGLVGSRSFDHMVVALPGATLSPSWTPR